MLSEEFGDGAILIRALPADIPAEDAAASLEDLAGRLVETHHAAPESARDALLHTMACKSAIKGGWKSDERELRVLVDKVQSGEVRVCPHGRPVGRQASPNTSWKKCSSAPERGKETSCRPR